MTTTTKTSTSATGRLSAMTIAVGLCLACVAAPAGAQTDPPSTTSTASTQAIPVRLERACLRIPNLTTRAQNAIERISGDADVRGSLAWLDAKIARASEQGRDDLATALENRRAVRAASVPVLEQRLVRLAALGERCAEAGVGA